MQESHPPDFRELEQAIEDRIRQMGLENDPEFVIELIDSYAPTFKRLRDSLLDAISQKDPKKLQYAAHSLKGASLNIGAKGLADVSKAIEEQSEQADRAAIDPLLAKLNDQLAKTTGALSSIRDRVSNQKSS